nr:proline-rich receptor-like protein kinase PERK12 [Aegilops tauschii subsp. strangulata]
MENKSCPESDGPVQMSFKFLKEITNNFAVELGCGASAEVYKGEFNRQAIAVKILPFKIGVDERLFQNEYEHLKRLNHPNIVRLVGFCDETELVEAEYEGKMINAEDIHRALCLEFLPNGPLSNHLHENYLGLEWKRHFQIIKGMCAGLKYIHDAPIVHLDIKPENILLDAEMIPKIGDFGISRVLRKECIGDANGTQLGTMGYIPPEFIQNRVISRGFDIFSLGVTIKKTMTGVMDYWNICYMKDEECIEHPGVGPILLLSVQPQWLCFPLTPTRLTSRPLCLTNNKDESIAFQLLTHNPGRYHTELPLCSVVPSKCTYTINMIVREQTKQLPSNSNEFLTLRSITMRENDLRNLDLDSIAVFFENTNHEVQEMMLPVVCDPPEETTPNQIIASKNRQVVLSVDVHPISQVLSMDVHPKEPWILTTNQRGTLCIWNYQNKETVKSFEVSPGEPGTLLTCVSTFLYS